MIAQVRFTIHIFVRCRSDCNRSSGQHVIDAAGKAQLLLLRRSQNSIYRNKDRLHALAVGLGVSFRGSRPKFFAAKAAQQEVMSASAQEELKHGQQCPGSGRVNDQESSN